MAQSSPSSPPSPTPSQEPSLNPQDNAGPSTLEPHAKNPVHERIPSDPSIPPSEASFPARNAAPHTAHSSHVPPSPASPSSVSRPQLEGRDPTSFAKLSKSTTLHRRDLSHSRLLSQSLYPSQRHRRQHSKTNDTLRQPLVFPSRLDIGADVDDDVAIQHQTKSQSMQSATASPQGSKADNSAQLSPKPALPGARYLHLNQSVVSLIAAAAANGSKQNFHGQALDEEEDEEELGAPDISHGHQSSASVNASERSASSPSRERPSRDHSAAPMPSTTTPAEALMAAAELDLMDQHSPDSEQRQSLHQQPSDPLHGWNYMAQSLILPPRPTDAEPTSPDAELAHSDPLLSLTPRDAPVLTRLLQAEADAEDSLQHDEASVSEHSLEAQSPIQAQMYGSVKTMRGAAQSPGTRSSSAKGAPSRTKIELKNRLQAIFSLEEAEDVLAEYPCWLLQSVLLQGYMYITTGHICFYAYLPQRSTEVVKTGYLAKRGRQNPRYSRYWCSLKGDVLSYYSDPSNLYFPSGTIDLRNGVAASLANSPSKHSKESSTDAESRRTWSMLPTSSQSSTSFTVTTHTRTYYFRADSAESAQDWVRTLQRLIFRTHNGGDSVKVSLPLASVLDVEESPVLDLADTIRIRVIDGEDTYALDEYFFSFFSFGQDALDVLRNVVGDNAPLHSCPTAHGESPRLHSAERQGRRTAHRGRSVSHSEPPSTPVLRRPLQGPVSPSVTNDPSAQSSSHVSSGWSTPSPIERRPRRSTELQFDFRRSAPDQVHGAMEREPRSASLNNAGRRPLPLRESSESFVEPSQVSSPSLVPTTDNGSGSHILSRSDVFQQPTIAAKVDVPPTSTDLPRIPTRRPSEKMSSAPVLNLEGKARGNSAGKAASRDEAAVAEEWPRSQHRARSPSLQRLVQGSFPLAKAAGFADYLRKSSKRMSALLAAESMGYVEKVSGMWAGGRQHYGDDASALGMALNPEEVLQENAEGHGDRFRAHFALPPGEKLRATFFGYLHRVLPLYGKLYISDRHLCFRSLLPGTKTKLILPLAHIENVTKERAMSALRYAGLVVIIQAHEELFFEFNSSEVCDDCCVTLLQSVESLRFLQESGLLSREDEERARAAQEEYEMLQDARRRDANEADKSMESSASLEGNTVTLPADPFDDLHSSIVNFKPPQPLRITCLTIGSRGDVQPYIALCKGLIAEGHHPTIATHREFEPWIRQHGIDFALVEGDPAELMRICVENGVFTYSFLKEASSKFRGWIDDLLQSAWQACQGAELLIESPSAMAGIHIAEALEIPYFRAFSMPWTRTRAYPHAFVVPERKMGGAYNYVTYVMFDNVFWTAIAGQVNRWRKRELGLRSTNLDKLHPNKVPFLYNFSPSVVVPPLDYSDWIRVTGYWFLDEGTGWNPPAPLRAFIAQARTDGKKLVYIGFGSIVVSDPTALTTTVVESVLKADVRCILSKGWSDRLGGRDASAPEVPLPPEIFPIKSAPHDWLFRQIDAAVHHGGAGTTGASLRAGLPTVIKPFFGDQFFFGSRVEDLGVGLCLKKLNVSVLSRALWEATHSERMIVKARVLGEQIRKENGVETAIQAIYRDLDYARSLIKHRSPLRLDDDERDADDEESWTFVGGDDDVEHLHRGALQAAELELGLEFAEGSPFR